MAVKNSFTNDMSAALNVHNDPKPDRITADMLVLRINYAVDRWRSREWRGVPTTTTEVDFVTYTNILAIGSNKIEFRHVVVIAPVTNSVAIDPDGDVYVNLEDDWQITSIYELMGPHAKYVPEFYVALAKFNNDY